MCLKNFGDHSTPLEETYSLGNQRDFFGVPFSRDFHTNKKSKAKGFGFNYFSFKHLIPKSPILITMLTNINIIFHQQQHSLEVKFSKFTKELRRWLGKHCSIVPPTDSARRSQQLQTGRIQRENHHISTRDFCRKNGFQVASDVKRWKCNRTLFHPIKTSWTRMMYWNNHHIWAMFDKTDTSWHLMTSQ